MEDGELLGIEKKIAVFRARNDKKLTGRNFTHFYGNCLRFRTHLFKFLFPVNFYNLNNFVVYCSYKQI